LKYAENWVYKNMAPQVFLVWHMGPTLKIAALVLEIACFMLILKLFS